MCVLSQYVSLIVKNNPSLINCSLCVRHIAPIFNANGHFFSQQFAVKLTYWKFRELQKCQLLFVECLLHA